MYGETDIHRDLHHSLVHGRCRLVGRLTKTKERLPERPSGIHDLLSSENRKLLADITAVNSEIVAVRKENEELKTSVDRLCTENSQLKDEVRQLREQIRRQE